MRLLSMRAALAAALTLATFQVANAYVITDQVSPDVTVLSAHVGTPIGGSGGPSYPQCGNDCTAAHEQLFNSPALHEIRGVNHPSFFCRLLVVQTVTRAAALDSAVGIGFYYSGWGQEGRFIPKAQLVPQGTVRLKNGEVGVVHRFTGLANCWLGSASSSTQANYIFKPYIAFHQPVTRTTIEYRNWDMAGDYVINTNVLDFDRSRDVLQ